MIPGNQRAAAWPSLNPGSLRHQIQIQARSSLPTSSGQAQPWATVWSGYAAITALTEREIFQMGALVSQFTHTIAILWPGLGVTVMPGMQVIANGKAFKIQAVDNVNELNVVVRLLCLVLNEAA